MLVSIGARRCVHLCYNEGRCLYLRENPPSERWGAAGWKVPYLRLDVTSKHIVVHLCLSCQGLPGRCLGAYA
jgi:hypothetical protein